MKTTLFTPIMSAMLMMAVIQPATVWAAPSQQAYLKASNTGLPDVWGVNDRFGYSAAVSGDTLVIAARYEASSSVGVDGDQTDNSAPYSGAAYVFVRSGTNWTQQAYLKASNTEERDFFGNSVAISGDTVVIGAPGEASSATGVNGDQNDNSAPGAGAAYVFVRQGTNWTQQAYLKASNAEANDTFGASVSISGETIVIGAYGEASNASGANGDQTDNSASRSGAAYVFVRNGTNWTQQAYLKASNPQAEGTFGISVATSGDTIVVGAYGEASNATGVNGNQNDNSAARAGAAYVFVRQGTNWVQQAYLKASNTDPGDEFGYSVALWGDTVVVGTGGVVGSESSNATGVNGNQTDNSATNSGAAYVFVRTGSNWTQQAYLKASNTGGAVPGQWGDLFGSSVSISEDIIVVGAFFEDSAARGVNGNQASNSAGNSGAAYVFVRSGTNWTQQAYLKASNTNPEDKFGRSVSVSGDTVVVGAIDEASIAIGVNGNQNDNSAFQAGAAYVFTGLGLPPALAVAGSAQNVTLSWPVGATNYVLEATTSLPAISWATVTNTPTVTATERSVQLPLTGPAQFFRLRQP